MKTRVVYCDSRNNKLLWKAALTRALSQDEPPKPRLTWWEAALRFVDALFSQ
jgi:hypothetical protein